MINVSRFPQINNKAMFRYSLEKGSKKFKCPSCGQKTFTRYIDNDTGEYLGTTKGRCDREVKCQHHNPPGYFGSPMRSPEENLTYSRAKIYETNDTDRINMHKLNQLKIITSWDYEFNNFVLGLQSLFNDEIIKGLIETFELGTSKKTKVIFWQLDETGTIRTGKAMTYDPVTLKRKGIIKWAHKLKTIENFQLQQCLFGLHQIRIRDSKDIICIVESEKTAVIMAGYYPRAIWMATGGINNMKREVLTPLTRRMKILFPDIGADIKWAKKVQKESHILIADWAKALGINPADHPGADLADFEHPSPRIETLVQANNCLEYM